TVTVKFMRGDQLQSTELSFFPRPAGSSARPH
ncbi:MAG: hypothetical protein ACI84O_001658, partial [Myxococcota bacterium]